MSSLASWTYTNVATIYPLIGHDSWSGSHQFGTPYLIKCTWQAKHETAITSDGMEFIIQTTFYSELKAPDGNLTPEPKQGDYIVRGDKTAIADPIKAKASKIMSVVSSDPSPFNEPLPDYEIMT